MTNQELIDALLSIELIGIHNDCQADEYQCPACFQAAPIKGYAFTSISFDSIWISHLDSCPLKRVRNENT